MNMNNFTVELKLASTLFYIDVFVPTFSQHLFSKVASSMASDSIPFHYSQIDRPYIFEIPNQLQAQLLLTPPLPVWTKKACGMKVNARCGPVINIINSQWYASATKIQKVCIGSDAAAFLLPPVFCCCSIDAAYQNFSIERTPSCRWGGGADDAENYHRPNVITENFTLYWSLFLPRLLWNQAFYPMVWQSVPGFIKAPDVELYNFISR
jgi:hypothetical protein